MVAQLQSRRIEASADLPKTLFELLFGFGAGFRLMRGLRCAVWSVWAGYLFVYADVCDVADTTAPYEGGGLFTFCGTQVRCGLATLIHQFCG